MTDIPQRLRNRDSYLCDEAAEEIERLQTAITHYEAALKAAWPEGAMGKSWEHWNEARKSLPVRNSPPVKP